MSLPACAMSYIPACNRREQHAMLTCPSYLRATEENQPEYAQMEIKHFYDPMFLLKCPTSMHMTADGCVYVYALIYYRPHGGLCMVHVGDDVTINVITYSRGNSEDRCLCLCWGTNISEGDRLFQKYSVSPDRILYGGPRKFCDSTRACNRTGCFQLMIDVKDVVILSGLVQPSNSTFY